MAYSNEPNFSVLNGIEEALYFIVKMWEDFADREKDPGFALVLQMLFYFLVLPIYLLSKLVLFLIKEFNKSRQAS